MATYLLAEILQITDDSMYREYVKKATVIVTRFGGEYIIKSEKFETISGEWETKRILLIRFENRKKFDECFQSDEYKKIVHLRLNSTVSKAIVIEN